MYKCTHWHSLCFHIVAELATPSLHVSIWRSFTLSLSARTKGISTRKVGKSQTRVFVYFFFQTHYHFEKLFDRRANSLVDENTDLFDKENSVFAYIITNGHILILFILFIIQECSMNRLSRFSNIFFACNVHDNIPVECLQTACLTDKACPLSMICVWMYNCKFQRIAATWKRS